MPDNGFSQDALLQYARSERGAFESALREFVEIPTVSVEPERKAEMTRGAEFAADLIRRFGGQARIVPTAGHPLVHGEFRRNPAWPTVTLYNHLDVQPAVVDDGWRTDPFRFTAKDGRYFGRGTTDDKGPALSALWGARYALTSCLRSSTMPVSRRQALAKTLTWKASSGRRGAARPTC